MVMREGLFRILAGEGHRFSPYWRQEGERKLAGRKKGKKKGWAFQRKNLIPFESGKCMFSLKRRKEKVNPGIVMPKPLVANFLPWMSFSHGKPKLFGKELGKDSHCFSASSYAG